MKKNKSLLLAACLLLGGCSANAQPDAASDNTTEKTEITLWHTFTEVHEETLQNIISEFNASQDAYTVTALTQPLDGFSSKVYEAASNGTGPDMVMLDASVAADYAEEGMAIDFSDYLDINTYQSRVSEGLFEESTDFADGAWHCIAIQSTGPVFFYDKTLYDELGLSAPKTWDDVENSSKKIYEAKGIPGFAVDSIPDLAIMLLNQSGVGYIDKETKTVNWQDDRYIELVDWFAKGVQEGYFQLAPTTGDYNSGDIGAHVLGAYIGSSAGLPFLDLGDHELACTSVPQLSNGAEKWVQQWTRNIIGFKSNETKEKGVAAFAEYFTNADNAAAWAIAFGGFSPYSDADSTSAYKEYIAGNIALQALAMQNDYAGALPVLKGSSTVRTELEKAVKKAATAQASAKDALNEAVQAANLALSE